MKYIALMRGVNVGGNMVIKMSDLKEAVAGCGFTNVSTFIQSGNIIFESYETDTRKIAAKLEHELSERFNYDSLVIVKTYEQLKRILSEVPSGWKTRKDMRCYLAFIKEPVTSGNVIDEFEPKHGVDRVDAGDGVLYLSTLLSGITKSGFAKLITKNIYKDITIRNYNTTRRILERMES
jgi:uncharacterized protein (DUF1697 family)